MINDLHRVPWAAPILKVARQDMKHMPPVKPVDLEVVVERENLAKSALFGESYQGGIRQIHRMI